MSIAKVITSSIENLRTKKDLKLKNAITTDIALGKKQLRAKKSVLKSSHFVRVYGNLSLEI